MNGICSPEMRSKRRSGVGDSATIGAFVVVGCDGGVGDVGGVDVGDVVDVVVVLIDVVAVVVLHLG